MTQQNLFDSIYKQKFDKFHKENPHVLEALIKMTDRAVAKGHKHFGMKLLFEVLRWETMISTKGDPYKINNNYAPYYVRLIEEKRPDLTGVFRKRELRS